MSKSSVEQLRSDTLIRDGTYLVRPLHEGRHSRVSNREDGRAACVLHRAQLERDLPRLVQLATICAQSRRVVFVAQIYHVKDYY